MIDAHAIAAAWDTVSRHVVATPCPLSQPLTKLFGGPVYLKMENLQVTGSFKERGACWKLASLSAEERARGVVTASAGNHAQAVAYHAARLQIAATVVMPQGTPQIKIARTRELGGHVVLHGAVFDDAYDEALRRADEAGLVFVSPYDDDLVIAGQGTCGLEILQQVHDLAQIVVPVGGGGLIGGISTAIKAARPHAKVIGVEAAAYPSMQASVNAGRVTIAGGLPTLADGIAVKRVSARTLELAQTRVDGLVQVSEEGIAKAILMLLERQKTLAEGAAAATLAALIEGRVTTDGPTVLVLSGGNIDTSRLDDILVRGLAADGRRLRLRVVMPDVPGQLHKLTGVIAKQTVNVLEVVHDREFGSAALGKTMSTLTLDTRGEEHVASLLEALRAAGFEDIERVPAATRTGGVLPVPGY